MADTKAEVTVVSAPKSFDMYTAPDFRRAIRHPVEHGAGFVVADLAGTEFMDGLGCGVLAGALRLADARGCRFGIACDSEPVLRVFRLVGLDRVFDIRGSVEAFAAKGASRS